MGIPPQLLRPNLIRTTISYDAYTLGAFLDANIILECRPLADLPWGDVAPDGPILALLTPSAMQEVDSKKHDGRIGKRAREFNRLISSVAAGGAPVVVRESAPRVELALARANPIPWDTYDDLDPNDGDSRIVAEILNARDIGSLRPLLISHDIKPIAFASGYDLDTLHVPDTWLRSTEPGAADRENQRLKQQLAAFQATQPELELAIDLPGSPFDLLQACI